MRLISNNTVECWGESGFGQLGSTVTAMCDPSKFDGPCSTTPYAVSNLSGVTQIASGDFFVCALLQNGTVQCWGGDTYGQLGNSGVTSDSPIPVPVSGVSGATAITAGSNFGCALTQSGQVLCWGYNSDGELGNGTTVASLTAVPVQF